jgi:hypothetical protein
MDDGGKNTGGRDRRRYGAVLFVTPAVFAAGSLPTENRA